MVRQFFKKKSKRQSTRTRCKIEKKVREHNRKVKRGKINKPNRTSKKDTGVPNSCPFKDTIIKEAVDAKQRIDNERQLQKERTKKQREKQKMEKRNLSSLVEDAQKRQQTYSTKNISEKNSKEYKETKITENSLKAYIKEFRKVVESADVILQVLDARDPLGSRCPQVEEAVLAAGASKRLVLVLNKIDLIPKENVEKWLKYLRNEFPTIPFKCNTQEQSTNLFHAERKSAYLQLDKNKTSGCIGAKMLMKLIGNYCRNHTVKTSVLVGVVGFPNTGKSSLINSLKRNKVCNIGFSPGITKTSQQVKLDKHVTLIDSPGIVMDTNGSDTALILQNCIRIETVNDVVPPVEAILRRCNTKELMLHYAIPPFNDVNEFLALLAKKMGKLKKGGVPHILKAGRRVLLDWNSGNISYYTHPPETHTMPTHVSSEIVTQMCKEFDIDALLKEETEALGDLNDDGKSVFLIDSFGPSNMASEQDTDNKLTRCADEEDDSEWLDIDEDDDDEEEEQEQEEENVMDTSEDTNRKQVTVSFSQNSKKSKGKNKKEAITNNDNIIPKELQLNKARKQDFKKMKKNRKRADKLGNQLSTVMDDAFAGLGSSSNTNDNYNFNDFFKKL